MLAVLLRAGFHTDLCRRLAACAGTALKLRVPMSGSETLAFNDLGAHFTDYRRNGSMRFSSNGEDHDGSFAWRIIAATDANSLDARAEERILMSFLDRGGPLDVSFCHRRRCNAR